MLYSVPAAPPAQIRLAESDRTQEILRNVALILTTPKGSVPLYRNFGLDLSFLDQPATLAQNSAIIPVREAIQLWEPRAAFKSLSLSQNSSSGKLSFTVQIEIGDDAP